MAPTQPVHDEIDVPGGPGLLEGVAGTSVESRDALIAGNRDVRTAASVLRHALDELHTSEDKAWRVYADEVHRALVHLDAELQVAAAQLRAQRAESREDLGVALHEVAQSWRARVDDARVQARLAQMERRDSGRSAIAELGRARTEVEHTVSALAHELGDSVDGARHAVTSAIGGFAHALRQAQAAVPPRD